MNHSIMILAYWEQRIKCMRIFRWLSARPRHCLPPNCACLAHLLMGEHNYADGLITCALRWPMAGSDNWPRHNLICSAVPPCPWEFLLKAIFSAVAKTVFESSKDCAEFRTEILKNLENMHLHLPLASAGHPPGVVWSVVFVTFCLSFYDWDKQWLLMIVKCWSLLCFIMGECWVVGTIHPTVSQGRPCQLCPKAVTLHRSATATIVEDPYLWSSLITANCIHHLMFVMQWVEPVCFSPFPYFSQQFSLHYCAFHWEYKQVFSFPRNYRARGMAFIMKCSTMPEKGDT